MSSFPALLSWAKFTDTSHLYQMTVHCAMCGILFLFEEGL